MTSEASRVESTTVASEDDEYHRCAYNGAFWDLGFKWQWDRAMYREFSSIPDEKTRIRAYIERHQPHLFRAYKADFLIDLIYAKKIRRYRAIIAAKADGRPLELTCNGLKAA